MRFALVLLTLTIAAWTFAPRAAHAGTRRVAVVVGNNAGDASLSPLRYAERDAEKVARALLEVGQVTDDDLFVVEGHGRAEVNAAIGRAAARIAKLHRRADNRVVLIFYFSGHSDGEAMELGGDRLSFVDLKRELAKSGAEVRIEIIDSCRSGAAVAAKGGKPVPAFTLRLADDLATTGDALMASSAANEASLESPELEGSYFTSALVSGLRGAADASGDKQVTLSEAYRYAYDHTVAATAVTLEGAQHPTFSFKLSGQGALVLSELQQPQAGLVLPDGLDRALVIDVSRDQVVAELLPGASRFLALSPGTYAVRAFERGKPLGTRVVLARGQTHEVHLRDLSSVAAPKVAAKGVLPASDAQITAAPEPPGAQVEGVAEPPRASRARVRLGLSAGATAGIASGLGPRADLRVSFEPGLTEGLAVIAEADYGASSGTGELGVSLRLGYQYPVHLSPSVTLGLGLDAGPGFASQHVENQQVASGWFVSAGPRASLAWAFTSHAALQLEGGVPIAYLKLDGKGQARALPSITAGVRIGL